MRNPLQQLFSQTAIYGLSSIVGRLLNYLLVPLYTRLFLPAEYGIVTEFYAYAGFLSVFLTYGMETAYFRFANTNDENKTFSAATASLLISSVIFAVIIGIFSPFFANILQYNSHSEYILWFAVIAATDAMSAIPFAQLRQKNNAKRFAALRLLNIGINISLNLFFLLLCPYLLEKNFDFVKYFYSKEIGVGYIFISNLVASVVTLVLLLPEFRDIRKPIDRVLLRKMLVYAAPLLVAGMAGMINETLDRILLKYFLTIPQNCPNPNEYLLSQMGIYGANYKISILMTLFVQTFRYAAEPFFFSQAKKDNAKEIFAKVSTYFLLAGLIIFLGIIAYLDIIKYFISAKYHEGLKIVPILLIANLCLGIYYNLSIWYKFTQQTSFGAYFSIMGAIITIFANILLIPILNYFGAALATFICYFSIMLTSYFVGQKYFPIPYNIRKISFYVFLCGILYFLMEFFVIQNFALNIVLRTIIFSIFPTFIFLFERKNLRI